MALWFRNKNADMEIPGWAPRIPNQVYVRERDEAQEFLILSKYREATAAEIVNYITGKIEAAENYSSLSQNQEVPVQVPTFEHLILHLPVQLRRNLQNNDLEAVGMVQETARMISTLKEGEHYFHAKIGRIYETDEISKGRPKKDFQWYWDQCYTQYSLNLLLPQQKLPPAKDITTLLQYETTNSSLLLAFHYGKYPLSEFKGLFKKIYSPLDKGGLEHLFDQSDFVKINGSVLN